MNAKTLRSQYPQLSTIERLALTLEALIRQDNAEWDALVRSCPRYRYTLPDRHFLEFHDRSQMLAYCFAAIWYQVKGDVDAAQSRKAACYLVGRFFEEGFSLALEACGTVPLAQSPVWQTYAERLKPYEALRVNALDAERESIAQIKGVYAGFLRFCQAVPIEPHQILVWVEPLHEEVMEFLHQQDAAIVEDPDIADIIFTNLSSLWPGVKGRSQEVS